MIHRAKFQNFKALRDVEVTFDSRLTVLVGPNGSGKTSVLQGIQFVGNFAKTSRTPEDYVDQSLVGSPLVFGWRDLGTTFDPTALEVGTAFTVESHQQAHVVAQYHCMSFPSGGNRALRGESISHEFSINEDRHNVSGNLVQLRGIRSAVLLQFDPGKLGAPSFTTRLPPVTAPDGSGLASALGYLLRKYPDCYKAVVEGVNAVIPNVVNIRLDLVQLSNGYGDALLFDFKGASGVSATSTSDGTLVVVGLVSVLLSPDGPRLVLLDDLDHRLHPKAQMDLVVLLRKLLVQFPDLQIIATSHSPYILDRLQPNEVRVMVLRDDGSAACARLEDHPKYPMWKDSMSPGEFWTHAGEDWVKQLAPPTAAP